MDDAPIFHNYFNKTKMIKGRTADIIVAIYLLVTLYIRFTVEDGLANHTLISLILGLLMLFFLWVLIKFKVLMPDYFGLLGKKKNKQE